MMIQIFVEGIADVKFLTDYVSHIIVGGEVIFPKDSTGKVADIVLANGNEVRINSIGGWTNLENIKNQLGENTDNEGINLVIFDADKLSDEKTIEDRREEIIALKGDNRFELFLFPNNNDSGALEELLEKIIVDKNQSVFDCWDGYERCLQSKTVEGRKKPLTTPAKKTKIYGYLEALLGETKGEKEQIKERERNYKNPEHWNLNSDHLRSLKEFLLFFLQ